MTHSHLPVHPHVLVLLFVLATGFFKDSAGDSSTLAGAARASLVLLTWRVSQLLTCLSVPGESWGGVQQQPSGCAEAWVGAFFDSMVCLGQKKEEASGFKGAKECLSLYGSCNG